MDVKADKTQVLYISIDGMTDPLGQSQVLPYLCGLAKKKYAITIISCEKEESFKKNHVLIESIMQANDISWRYTHYDKKIPFLSQRSNLTRLRRLAFDEASSYHKPFIVHCRSYLAAMIGNRIKKKYGAKLIFDMRGFWADERVEGGIWNLKNPLHRSAYRFFKKKEKELIAGADHIVTLSQRARRIINGWKIKDTPAITTIPCCADLDHFKRSTSEEQLTLRNKLHIHKEAFVVGYLGSLGTWYMLDEMLDFFSELLKKESKAVFFFVTPDEPSLIEQSAKEKGIPQNKLVIRRANRNEVPTYISVFDAGLFFIRPTFSKQASSPTKMAEILACGVPVITNTGIGDCDSIIQETHCGILVKEFNTAAYHAAIEEMSTVQNDADYLRSISERYFSLKDGVKNYAGIYDGLSDPDKEKP